jgi:uncharacterized membrane protein YjgN (DUF898 family)
MRAKIISIKESPATFYVLLVGIMFAAVFYIYYVNISVRNVVAREQSEEKIAELRNSVSELEFKYINSENIMTLEKAKGLGLLEPLQKIFISKNSTNKPLTINKP